MPRRLPSRAAIVRCIRVGMAGRVVGALLMLAWWCASAQPDGQRSAPPMPRACPLCSGGPPAVRVVLSQTGLPIYKEPCAQELTADRRLVAACSAVHLTGRQMPSVCGEAVCYAEVEYLAEDDNSPYMSKHWLPDRGCWSGSASGLAPVGGVAGCPQLQALRHGGGLCMQPPDGQANHESWNVLRADCAPKLLHLPNGALQHVDTGLCLHPRGGWAIPAEGTPVVWHPDCETEDKLHFEQRNATFVHARSGKCLSLQDGFVVLSASCNASFELVAPVGSARGPACPAGCVSMPAGEKPANTLFSSFLNVFG
jgi:hypothetical protein